MGAAERDANRVHARRICHGAVLRSLRGTLAWWPFHPAGYALAVKVMPWDYFWFPFFISG